jgi:hypothetical protein
MTGIEITIALLSFVYALALTNLLQSVSDLWVARHRVRFSLGLASWMLVSGLLLILNWLVLAPLAKGDWSYPVVLANLLTAITQYFTCSLVAMRVPDDGMVDMKAHEERQGHSVRVAYLTLVGWAMGVNLVHWDALGAGPLTLAAFVSLSATELAFSASLILGFWRKERWLIWGPALAYAAYLLAILLDLA